MTEAIVERVLFELRGVELNGEGDGTTIRFSDRGLSNLPGPPQLAYHGPLAEDQTISEDRVQQSKTAAGTLVTVPLRTTNVATTLTVLLPEVQFGDHPGRHFPAKPLPAVLRVDFQTVAITTTRMIPTQQLNITALGLKGTASQVLGKPRGPVIVPVSSAVG